MNTDNLFAADTEQLRQQGRISDCNWDGAAVIEMSGTLAELYQWVPLFSRHPFRSSGNENRYKDEIRREPRSIEEEQFPIATVSKTYSLIQHRDVLSSIYRALKLLKFDCDNIGSSLLMTEYGERMQWSCELPKIKFDPGDGHPILLRMNCLNSVDMTTSLEVTLTWYRVVCSNGLMFGLGDSRLRKRHIHSLDPEDVAAHIQAHLQKVDAEQDVYREWFKRTMPLDAAAQWADESVAKEWGVHAAARVWHIIERGIDGEVQATKEKRLPHELQLKSSRAVPGAPSPAQNLFHASQALSWLAGTRNNFQERIEYLFAIPSLMTALTDQLQ